jgi:hypothetical protein
MNLERIFSSIYARVRVVASPELIITAGGPNCLVSSPILRLHPSCTF